ncbi:Surfeit locus protein 1 [Trametes pubescens]|uniref:SURF1-like protein n=1 Tax=Trametes pubescens TaxID=154538 RepID=A0A1M2W7W2_TRAPU|nr:Surfeit locus protein 1 [Trametes pubescens]
MLATEGSSQTYKAKREPLITPTMILIGIMPIFTFALGTWQVQRLKWKVALIDELEEKLEREPMPLPPQINLAALPDFSFRKVVLKGRWDNAHAILLGPRVRDGTIGYHLVVPFVRTDGSTVLVDRGFVSKDLAQTAKQNQSTVQGEVEILGMLRTAQPRNSFTPDNHPDEGKWYWADVDAMAAHVGGEASGVQPVFIEEVFESSESYSTEDVTKALRHKQRMQARHALKTRATENVYTPRRLPELVPSHPWSCTSSPANSPPPTPRLRPVDIPFPEQSRDLVASDAGSSGGGYLGVAERVRLYEEQARAAQSPFVAVKKRRPYQCRSSVVQRILSRPSSRGSMVSPSPPPPATPASAIMDMVRRLPPLPRFNPYRRARAESMSSAVGVGGRELGGSFYGTGIVPRRRCKSEPSRSRARLD